MKFSLAIKDIVNVLTRSFTGLPDRKLCSCAYRGGGFKVDIRHVHTVGGQLQGTRARQPTYVPSIKQQPPNVKLITCVFE